MGAPWMWRKGRPTKKIAAVPSFRPAPL